MAEARAIGVRLPFVAGVAVYTDERSAAVLLRFPGLGLDAERVAECSPHRTRWRPGARRRCGRPGPCSRSTGSSGSTCPGSEPGRGERAGAEIKAAIGARDQRGASMTDAMEAEFDLVAEWTRQAVRELGDDHALPAACQGSASPVALDWLAAACGLDAGTRLLDVGGGTGGPAAYAAETFGARPLVVDPMPGACRTARALFSLPVAVGAGEALPVATGFPAVWCLGVLCTTPERPALLRELRRVLPTTATSACWCSNGGAARLRDTPEGNDFPVTRRARAAAERRRARRRRPGAVRRAGARAAVVERAGRPGAGRRRRGARHRPALPRRAGPAARIADLLADGEIGGELVHARTAAGSRHEARAHRQAVSQRTYRDEPRRQSDGENRLPPTLAVVVAAALYTLLPDTLRLGPRLVVPAVEVVLLVALLITNPRRITRETRTPALVSMVLAAVVVGTNLVALGLLVADLVAGRAEQPGPLLLAGLQVWATSVIGFALVYWELDRGGPVARPAVPAAACRRRTGGSPRTRTTTPSPRSR